MEKLIADLTPAPSVRTQNVLKNLGVEAVADLPKLTEQSASDIMAKRNVGTTTLQEIRGLLSNYGLALIGELPLGEVWQPLDGTSEITVAMSAREALDVLVALARAVTEAEPDLMRFYRRLQTAVLRRMGGGREEEEAGPSSDD